MLVKEKKWKHGMYNCGKVQYYKKTKRPDLCSRLETADEPLALLEAYRQKMTSLKSPASFQQDNPKDYDPIHEA